MSLSGLPDTSQGVMVGDYISTSYAAGTARPAFEVAHAPTAGVFDHATYVPATGLLKAPAPALVPAGNDQPVPGAASDHAASAVPLTAH